MKNKELAELLGIEPKYKIESGSRVFYFALKDKAKAEKQLNWLNYVNQNIDDYLLYPDFENPVNFVKLLELINNNSQEGIVLVSGLPLNDMQWIARDNFAFIYAEDKKPTMAVIKYACLIFQNYCDKLKQQAQQADWVY